MKLIRLGYWQLEAGDGWPRVTDLFDLNMSSEEAETLVIYLNHGMVARAYIGYAYCQICGLQVGALELTDGYYVWPVGLSHYVEKHHVRLPVEFLRHIERQTDLIEDAEIDEAWWKSIGDGR